MQLELKTLVFVRLFNSSSVTSADQNVSVGFNSMGLSVSTASRNVVVGFDAGEFNDNSFR